MGGGSGGGVTGDEVTMTAGGAGDGDAFLGGVCDRGDGV